MAGSTGVLLVSAARSAAASGDVSGYRHPGVMLFLDVTVAGGVGNTLTVALQVKNPATGIYHTVTAFPAPTANTTGTFIYEAYPGALESALTANLELQGVAVPADWRALVTPSAGTWTYSLAYQSVG